MGIFRKKKKKEKEPVVPELPSLDDYEEVVKESEMISPEEAQAKISLMLAEPKKLELMADISKEEQKRLAALKTIGDTYDLPLVKAFVNNYLELSVSLNRGGRSEVVDVSRPAGMQRETMRRGLRDILLGRSSGGMR